VCRFLENLTGASLRKLIIRAGFPYHKAPHYYERLWVFIMLPFMEEESPAELTAKHGKELKNIYPVLNKYPHAYDKVVRLLSMPLLFNLISKFDNSDETGKSRSRIRIIIDDTIAEKFGKNMEFIHKLFDHAEDRYIKGYNYILLLAVSGETVFPLSFVLWLPKTHTDYRSRNDIAADEIMKLKSACENRSLNLEEAELLSDSAYCVQKVVNIATDAGFRVITKAGNTHKFEYSGEDLTPREIIEKVKNGQWKYLEPGHSYQRIKASHHVYGAVILTVRRRELKNGKIIYDVLMCNKDFVASPRIHKSYKARWEIELHFKYYKQYLKSGKSQFRKLGSVRSCLYCVAIAGLIVSLFRTRSFRNMSFRSAVRMISQELYL